MRSGSSVASSFFFCHGKSLTQNHTSVRTRTRQRRGRRGSRHGTAWERNRRCLPSFAMTLRARVVRGVVHATACTTDDCASPSDGQVVGSQRQEAVRSCPPHVRQNASQVTGCPNFFQLLSFLLLKFSTECVDHTRHTASSV